MSYLEAKKKKDLLDFFFLWGKQRQDSHVDLVLNQTQDLTLVEG